MMLDNDGIDAFMLDFTVTEIHPVTGKASVIPLKDNGEDIDVTDENKLEYCNLFLQWRLLLSIQEQLGALMQVHSRTLLARILLLILCPGVVPSCSTFASSNIRYVFSV